MIGDARQRIDVWLFRTRLAKTRAAAAGRVSEGGVRLVRDGSVRRLEKPSAEVAVGDALLLRRSGRLVSLRVEALPVRRGPASEARSCYSELDADALA
jgi:ribosome-associated heat shock protein Hsp15